MEPTRRTARPLMALLGSLALVAASMLLPSPGRAAPPAKLVVTNQIPGIQDVVPGKSTELDVWFQAPTRFKSPQPKNAHVELLPGDSGLVFGSDASEDVTFESEEPWIWIARQAYTATAGLHHVTITLTSDNYPTATVTVLVWGEGGPALVGTKSLAGIKLSGGWETHNPGDEETEIYHHFLVLDFLDKHWVWMGDRSVAADYDSQPAPRAPAVCTASIKGCAHYAYDPSIHQFQIGADRGILRAHVSSFGNYGYDQRYAYPKAGSHPKFSGSYEIDGCCGSKYFSLRLTTSGSYVRTVRQDAGPSFFETGKYAIGKLGGLTLTPKKKGTKQPKKIFSSIAVLLDAHGKPAAAKRGVLFLGIRFTPSVKK